MMAGKPGFLSSQVLPGLLQKLLLTLAPCLSLQYIHPVTTTVTPKKPNQNLPIPQHHALQWLPPPCLQDEVQTF